MTSTYVNAIRFFGYIVSIWILYSSFRLDAGWLYFLLGATPLLACLLIKQKRLRKTLRTAADAGSIVTIGLFLAYFHGALGKAGLPFAAIVIIAAAAIAIWSLKRDGDKVF